MDELSMNSIDFYKALDSQQLIGSSCQDCGYLSVPQRRICPQCLGSKTTITNFSGSGRLAAFTVIYVPSMMMAQEGYSAKNPYCVGIVELEEGPRISAQILELDLNQPGNIDIGRKLSMTTITRNEGENQKTFLAFRPA